MKRRLLKLAVGGLLLSSAVVHALTHDEKALFEAAQLGDAETVRALLAQGVSPKTTGEFGQTPLMYAAESGDLATVKTLLEAGADLHARCSVAGTPSFMRSSRVGSTLPLT